MRPDEAKRSPSAQEERSVSGCTEPAGESPAPVGAGAPGSRPRASGEIPAAQAGCREPLRREQARGPQHQVNAAASSDKQRESRAAHVTAKATSDDPVPERSAGFLGVGAVRGRVQAMDTRLLLGPRASPSPRNRPLPGSCVMLRLERSPVSRVRENRTHGSKGGFTITPMEAR